MLDLIISYLHFLILSLKYITKKISFRPPNPKGYRLIKNGNQETLEILYKTKPKITYQYIKLKDLEYSLIKIPNEDNKTFIPIFEYKPLKHKNHCIIYAHGNSGDIGTSLVECYYLATLSESVVLCFEFPEYGLSNDQNLNEKRFYYNIRKTYEYAVNVLNFKAENIMAYGFSIGTGIVFDLACDKKYPIAGLILQSPFLSILRILYNFKKTYYFDIFNNCDKAHLINTKVFFIHGNKDIIVPYIHGRILAKMIPKKFFYSFFTVKDANHNNLFVSEKNRDEIYSKIVDFVNFCIPEKEKKDYINNKNFETLYKNENEKYGKGNYNNKNLHKFDISGSFFANYSTNDELQKIKSKDESLNFLKSISLMQKKRYLNSKICVQPSVSINNNNEISDNKSEMSDKNFINKKQINIPEIKLEFKNYDLMQKKIDNDGNYANNKTVNYNANFKNNITLPCEEENSKNENSENIRNSKKKDKRNINKKENNEDDFIFDNEKDKQG